MYIYSMHSQSIQSCYVYIYIHMGVRGMTTKDYQIRTMLVVVFVLLIIAIVAYVMRRRRITAEQDTTGADKGQKQEEGIQAVDKPSFNT